MNYSEILLLTKTYNEVDLVDFINHYKALNFNKITILNNDSTIDIKKFASDTIEIIDIRGEIYQNAIYQDYFKEKRSKWVFVVDDDEFLYLGEDVTDVNSILENYENHPGLSINWQMISSQPTDDRLTLSFLDYCVYIDNPCSIVNSHVKTIINNEYSDFMIFIDPHLPIFNERQIFSVNFDKIEVKYPFNDSYCNKILLYHYFVKSRKDWEIKVNRPRPSFPGKKIMYSYDEICIGYNTLDNKIESFKEKYHGLQN
jgi:hypothetical protein